MTEIFGVFGVEVKTLLLQMVNFGIALTVLWYFLYRPFIALLEKRRKDTIEAVANAQRAAAELAEADVKKKELLTKANLEAEHIIANTTARAKEMEAALMEEAYKKREQLLAEATAQATEAKKRALAESKEEIAKLVVLGAEKVLRNS